MSEHVVYFNERPRKVELDQVTGFDLRAIFLIDPTHEIVVEVGGSDPDRVLLDDDVLQLGEQPVHIFSRPPATFGA